MSIAKFKSSWRFLVALTATLVMACGIFGDRTRAQQPVVSLRDANFDIRSDSKADSVAYRKRVDVQTAAKAALASAREAGIDQLRGEFPALELLDSPLTGTLEVLGISPGSGFLTERTADRVEAMRGFIARHADAYGLSQEQVQSLDLVANYTNPAGNMSWVEFEQRINGVPVFQGLVRGGFTKDGELARLTGPLASGLDAASLRQSAAIDPAKAVSLAAAHVGWNVPENTLAVKAVDADGQRVTFARGSMADDAKAWPVYFPLAPGVARLAWATEIWGDPDVFLVVLDAEDGTVLFRKNQTNYQTQSATYNIYNDDSPAPMSPSTVLPGSGTQAPFIGRTSVTLIGNEAPNTFNNLGWMTDGLNETDGNNVRAGLDLVPPDGIESTVAGSGRVFNFSYNPQTDDPSTAAYRNGEVTDMFYWANRHHDSLYLLGFTEAARNFQNDNFGRGGVAGDKVKAEGQDYSGTNNANFSTPTDGGQGRMQMYIFPGPTPHRTSGIDHDVVLHELTHGTSNRLHNNATGLASQLSAGMGEGWSDFYARALLSSAGEDVNGIYSTGGWVTNQISPGFADNYYYGIRRFPYAVKTTVGSNGRPHNPLTLADIDPLQINLSDGAFPPAFVGAAYEVHNIGELWCMALLEGRARFITRLGFATGNQRFLQFVTDGMKLDPVNPTPIQGRDSILAAAAAGGGTAADIADIWAGFAARGMGVLATINGSTFAAAENFNVPGTALPTLSINDVSVVEGNSGTTNATFTVTLANQSAMLSDARVTWATADGTATAPGTTFTATGPINVPDVSPGSPYPLNLAVAGLPASVTHVRVRLNAVAHTFAGDLDVVLVGPGGQKVRLMESAWNGFNPGPTASNLTFEDGAPRAALIGVPVTGTYSPTDFFPGFNIVAPGPAGPYSTALSVFNGTNPNGTWKLYVADESGGDVGTIGGFSLIFSTPSTDDYVPSSGQLTFTPGGPTTQNVSVPINGDGSAEPNETFFVNLSNAIGVAVSDAQGVGTIVNDDGVAPPTVVTLAAQSVTSTTAILSATVNPNGVATTYNFQYGTTTAYGSVTSSFSAGSGSSPLSVAIGVGGLACNTLYHYRGTATSSGGTSFGSDVTFTTTSCLPTVTTGFPTSFNATGATLNGTANPNGNATSAWFDYGLTTGYGNTTPVQSLGSGVSAVSIGGGTLSGLTCDTVYHFRATATDAFGMTNGPDRTFSPPCAGTLNSSLLAVANDTSALRVFNASTLTPVAIIPVPSQPNGNYDVVVMPNQSLAFAARQDGVWVVDLTMSPPALATGVNPIPTPGGMPFIEDMSLTRDGRFLVASDGSATSPIAVINTATRGVVGTMSVLGDHNSVEVCDNGSVLVTNATGTTVVRRLTINATGALTDTGQQLALPGAGPNSTVCAPGGTVGVVVDLTGDLRSFLINGMTPIATQPLPGTGFGLNLAITPDGTKVFGRRSSDMLTAYAFNPTTGNFGGQLWSTNVSTATTFYGVDQIAVDPGGRRVFATTNSGFVLSLNAATGVLNGGAVASSPTGIALKRGVTVSGDFDGDGKTDPAVYRPSTGFWLAEQSSTNYATFAATGWGVSTDVPVPGDYDGDGKADLAVYRPSTGVWFILQSSTNYTTFVSTAWGVSTDVPVPGDYDGDGKTDLAVYRPSTGTWFILQSSTNNTTFASTAWGVSTDVPVPGDYDGDGKADLAVYRPSTGTWFILQSSTNNTTFASTGWGVSTDMPVPGDYDGDGKADLAVYRPSTGTWFILQSSTNNTTFASTAWGVSTDVPVRGDYDGDGKADLAVYRPSTGVWFILQSSTNNTAFITTSWGTSADVPVVGR